ncbi:MAG TPA: fused MFS/spermidine synthase [Bacteroidia bacterium]|nr:fused MFS/spermidine synthase [Bacteroidia bacterium]
MTRQTGFLYLLSFLEGAAVMAAELLGAKMLAPYFGSSLYVWSSVMAITLGGLASGYFLGGLLSYRRREGNVLYYVIFGASVLIVLMPFTSKVVLSILGLLPLYYAVIASTFVFLFPPVFMMGMVSPLIIRNLTTSADQAGKAAGAVYAISTVGGIISTFLTGFWIIPHFGLSRPCIVIGIILGFLPLIMLVKNNKALVLFFLVLSGYSFYKAGAITVPPGVSVPYFSEGLLGQIMLVDYPNYGPDGKVTKGTERMLFVNRIAQSVYNNGIDSARYCGYVYKILDKLRFRPKGASVLVCGLGGGSLLQALKDSGCRVEACELDPRIWYVARHYFKMDTTIPVSIDDARHFIRKTNKKYDVVILDLFKGEENPGHCFTTEAFQEMKGLLTPNGLLVLNGNGFFSGKRGAGTRALYKTLLSSGFAVWPFATDREETRSNLIFFAQEPSGTQLNRLQALSRLSGDIDFPVAELKLSESPVMTDDKPILDLLNAQAYNTWRNATIDYFSNEAQRGRVFQVFQ